MRIDLKIEDGKPILVITKIDGYGIDKVLIYDGAHSEGDKKYALRLKRPKTTQELEQVLRLLARWANLPN